MFKKLLAGLTAIALSLGMVALTAAPASAHAGNITASAVCNPATGNYDVTFKLSWSNVPNGVSAPIYTRTDNNLNFDTNWGYPGGKSWTDRGTTTGASGYIEWVTTLPGTTSGNGPWEYAYTPWSNGHNGATKHDTRIEGLDGECGLPDDTDKKVEICHAAGGSGNFTANDVSVSAVLNGTGHGGHSDDIIPPFTYVKNGVPGSYPGQNWDAYGQALYAADCNKPTATPAVPTFAEAACIAAGQPGEASYVIPATPGITYTVRINGAGGFVEQSANTYYVPAGTTVEVKAEALAGYVLGAPNSWTKTFMVLDCIVETTPTPATFSVLECVAGVATQASYTIPATVGVKYTVQLNGIGGFIEQGANTYKVAQGTLVEIKAVALGGYEIAGDDEWSKAFGTVDCRVSPGTPTFTSAVCTPNDGPGTFGEASYTIPTTEGVQYQVRFAPYGSWSDAAAGTHFVSAGQYVEVRAVGVDDYVLTGTAKWTKKFTAPDCDVEVIPLKPTWTEAVCTGEQEVGSASYTIPAIEGVQYQRQTGLFTWVDVAPGVHNVVDGTLLSLRALPEAGYEFPGSQVRFYLHLFDNFDESKDCLVPDEPTFDPQECSAPGDPSQANYTIPADSGVKYQIWDGSDWVTIAAGNYHVDTFPTNAQIRAVPKHGYSFLPGAVTEWSFDFTSVGDCIEEATATPATAVNQECVVDQNGGGSFVSGYLVIPNSPNVEYFIDGSVTPEVPGQVDKAPGIYTVSAAAAAGYELVGYTGPWVLEIVAADVCGDLIILPVVDPVVTFAQTTCSVSGSYTLAVEPAEEAAGVIWTVTGGLPNTVGTHAVTTAGTVTVTATAAPGYGFSGDDDGFMEWSFEFSALPDDCLPTLALTGGASTAGGLGLSALLTLGGILLIAARKREALAPTE